MTGQQLELVLLLIVLLVLFVWGRIRHDIVAAGGLMAAVMLGLVPLDRAFSGFAHAAVITVAAMLILTKALSDSGATNGLAAQVSRFTRTLPGHVAALSGVTATLSTVMNNVGALALMLPVAMQTAARTNRSPSRLLMPMSFAALLGGLVTMIGTPPNIIAATYRGDALGRPFAMFDFTWVGLPVALMGIAFIALIGWRLLPDRRRSAASLADYFNIADYVTEVRVGGRNPLIGKTIGEVGDLFAGLDVAILGLLREERQVPNVPRRFQLRPEDVLIIEASPQNLEKLIERYGLAIEGVRRSNLNLLSSEDVRLAEVVIQPGSELDGRSGGRSRLSHQFNVNLLAVAREGSRARDRLDRIVLRAGDVLLLQGEVERLTEVTRLLGCLPLAGRRLQVAQGGARAMPTLAIFGIAVGLAATGLLPLQIALGSAIVLLAVTNLLPPRELYDGIDWPVIVLLAAMIPIGDALQTTGVTDLLAGHIATASSAYGAIVAVILVFLVTMVATDILNNAATVVIMAPIAIGVAEELGNNPDTFLMAVAIAGSAAFLTPIGHQNNTLIMGPGGYRFTDYWRLGLPLQAVVVATAIPILLQAWPLDG